MHLCFVFDTLCKQVSGICSPGALDTQLDSMPLARQERNVEAGQVTEYEGITYATIKVRPCGLFGRDALCRHAIELKLLCLISPA